MPHLRVALAAARWRSEPAWKVAAHNIGGKLRPFALLADEFCPWADRMRVLFHNLVQMSPVDRPPALPPPLLTPIPKGLTRWAPLKRAFKQWRSNQPDRVLARLHEQVFRERGYEKDVWIRWEDGRRLTYPGRASSNVTPEGSNCRWENAVALMRPAR